MLLEGPNESKFQQTSLRCSTQKKKKNWLGFSEAAHFNHQNQSNKLEDTGTPPSPGTQV